MTGPCRLCGLREGINNGAFTGKKIYSLMLHASLLQTLKRTSDASLDCLVFEKRADGLFLIPSCELTDVLCTL